MLLWIFKEKMMKNTEHFTAEDIDENSLVSPFHHRDEYDSYIFSSPLLGKVPNKKLIDAFILEVLGGEQYEMYEKIGFISASEAQMLLRQMAMFDVKWQPKKQRYEKEKQYTPSEAKLAAAGLMAFLGNQVEFYTNVQSVSLPHDNPGRVMTNDSEGTFNAISLFIITGKYLIFISQTWHDD